MSPKSKYENLQTELLALERKYGLYLFDPCIDHENIAAQNLTEGTDDYWAALFSAACDAAGGRAEEAGYDINELLGRIIY